MTWNSSTVFTHTSNFRTESQEICILKDIVQETFGISTAKLFCPDDKKRFLKASNKGQKSSDVFVERNSLKIYLVIHANSSYKKQS